MKCKNYGQEMPEYQEVKHEGKTFRIYKWENKPVEDFKYPKGFGMAPFQKFTELINCKKFELEVGKYYFVKHFLESQWDEEYCLSWVYLDGSGDVDSDDGNLSVSSVNGRVVCIKDEM